MKILVGIIGNDAARFHLFTSSVMKLDTEGITVDKEMLIGGDWCGARNTLVEMTLEGDYTHLWFMDDDHAFAPDLLKRLLSHNVALVNPLCLARVAPFPLVTYAKTEDGKSHMPIDLTGLPPEGLVEIHAGGAAGMLIRRDVLIATDARNIPDVTKASGGGWFEYGDVSEDVIFCEKARNAGFKIYVDLGARLGHITTTVVLPDMDQGVWMTRLKIGGGLDLFVSPAQDWQAEEEQEAEVPSEPWVGTRLPGQEIDRGLFPPEEEPPTPDLQAPPDDEFFQTVDGIRKRRTMDPVPENQPADRIEIWVDADLRWWWRAIPEIGDAILGHGSAVNEEQAIADAARSFPEVPVHIIQRELDDSRSPQMYGPPLRLWNRGS